MDTPLPRRLAAEGVGTAMLVLFGAGSVVAALTVGDGSLDYAGLGFISLTFGIVVALVIYGFGPVSGAHINPAVTLALALTGRFAWRDVAPYVLAQLVGATLGAALVTGVFGSAAVDLGLGTTTLAEGVSAPQGILAEGLGTFLLMFTVMAVAVDARAPLGWAGFLIGLAVACAILLIGPQTGGSLNPARTFGPELVLSLGGGESQWADLAVYWIGPIVGSTAAALLYDFVAQTRTTEAAPPESFTATDTDSTET